jgi:hypothetical protein
MLAPMSAYRTRRFVEDCESEGKEEYARVRGGVSALELGKGERGDSVGRDGVK